MKLNSDGSLENGIVGYGGVLRDCEGQLLLSYHDICEDQIIYLTELRGALVGLQNSFFLTGGKVKLWIEMDSSLCVGCISRHHQIAWRARTLVSRIWDLLNQFGDFQVTHILRESNKAADYMSKFAPDNHLYAKWELYHVLLECNLPFQQILDEDRAGQVHMRVK